MIIKRYLSKVLYVLALMIRDYGQCEPIPLVRPSDDHLKLQASLMRACASQCRGVEESGVDVLDFCTRPTGKMRKKFAK